MELPPCDRCHRGNIWWDGEDYVCVQCGHRPEGYETDRTHVVASPYEVSLSQQVREMVNGIAERMAFRRLH